MKIEFEIDMDAIENKTEKEKKDILKKKMDEIHNIEKIVFETLKDIDGKSHDKIMDKHRKWLEKYPYDQF